MEGASESLGSLIWDYFSGFMFIQGSLEEEITAGCFVKSDHCLGPEAPILRPLSACILGYVHGCMWERVVE